MRYRNRQTIIIEKLKWKGALSDKQERGISEFSSRPTTSTKMGQMK
jgi:hypothetical protein